MKIIRENSVAFSGHREGVFDSALAACLKEEILKANSMGFNTFLSGMADGFDLFAAAMVAELKESNNLRFVAVIPYQGHILSSKQRELYQEVLSVADEVVTLASGYNSAVFHVRNGYLVDHSARLIAYHSGKRGGTANTVTMAFKAGLDIVNMYKSKVTDQRLPLF